MSWSVEKTDEPKYSSCPREFIFIIPNQLEKQKDSHFPYYLLGIIRSIKERTMGFFNDKKKML